MDATYTELEDVMQIVLAVLCNIQQGNVHRIYKYIKKNTNIKIYETPIFEALEAAVKKQIVKYGLPNTQELSGKKTNNDNRTYYKVCCHPYKLLICKYMDETDFCRIKWCEFVHTQKEHQIAKRMIDVGLYRKKYLVNISFEFPSNTSQQVVASTVTSMTTPTVTSTVTSMTTPTVTSMTTPTVTSTVISTHQSGQIIRKPNREHPWKKLEKTTSDSDHTLREKAKEQISILTNQHRRDVKLIVEMQKDNMFMKHVITDLEKTNTELQKLFHVAHHIECGYI